MKTPPVPTDAKALKRLLPLGLPPQARAFARLNPVSENRLSQAMKLSYQFSYVRA